MVNNDKLVSIAMATYNGEKYLREQLDSIYNQTYKNIEVIVCDDCSVDETVTILEEYKQKYGLIYYINEKNLGFVKNFEKAASLCNGEFIAFSDQDDIWLPEKIETLVNEICDYSLIHTNSALINANGEDLNDTLKSRLLRELGLKQAVNFKGINKQEALQGAACLFKKNIATKAIPFPSEFYHDYWISLVALKMNGIKYIDRCLVKYRLHNNNAVGINQECEYLSRINFFKKYFLTLYKIARYLYRLINYIRIQFILKQRGF